MVDGIAGATKKKVTPEVWATWCTMEDPDWEPPTRAPTRRSMSTSSGTSAPPASPVPKRAFGPRDDQLVPEAVETSRAYKSTQTLSSPTAHQHRVPDTTEPPGSIEDMLQEMKALTQCLRRLGYLAIGTNSLATAASCALLGLATYLYLWTRALTLTIQNDVMPSLARVDDLIQILQQIFN